MVEPADQYSFSDFASLDFYKKINARLLDLADIGCQRRIIDLGCGTGGVTELILDRIEAARDTVIYAIDHSAAAIRTAIANLGHRKEAAIKFIEAEVHNLREAVKEQIDTIVYCNSIHYVQDKAALLGQIKEQLKPGGTFAFNTSFFEGSHPPESEPFYRRWMMRSLRILKREYGLSPKKADKVESRRHLSPAQYEELLAAHGFSTVEKEVLAVDIPVDGWYYISSFRDFIEGVMPGVPLDTARAALQQAVREVFDEIGMDSVRRDWLEIVAVRA